MAWSKITNALIAVDKPITNALMTSYRDNQIESAPTGQIIDWPTNTPPSGFLSCDGSAINRTTYAALFAAIGVTYGAGDGSTTFNIPDRRGEFVRGWANGSANDPDRAGRTDRGDGTTGDNVGTKQGYQYQSHGHSASWTAYTFTSGSGAMVTNGSGSSATSIGVSVGASGGNETRPRNVYTNYCIRYTGD